MLPVKTKTEIARAYHVGARPSDLAREYGISVPHVLMISKRHDAAMYADRRKRHVVTAREQDRLASAAKKASGFRREAVIEPPSIETPEPLGTWIEERAGQNIVVHHRDVFNGKTFGRMRISLPFISMQFGAV